MKKKDYQIPDIHTDINLDASESLLLATSLTPDGKDNTHIETGDEDEEWNDAFLSDKKGFDSEDFWNK